MTDNGIANRMADALEDIATSLRDLLDMARSMGAMTLSKIRQCEMCGKPIKIGGENGGRSDKRFCDSACRTRYFRVTRAPP
jgi:hypothetical protein